MKAPRVIELSDAEQAELASLLNHINDVRSRRRISALLRLSEGDPPELIADAFEVHLATVYRWVERYRYQRRDADLLEQPRSGRPAKLREIDPQWLEQLLSESPERYGYRATTWTVSLLRTQYEREFGLSLSDETLRRRLHQQEYRWKRPRYIFHEADPHKGQKKGASFER